MEYLKIIVLINAYAKVKGINSYCIPSKNSSVGHMPVKFPANHPPTIPRAMLKIIKNGLIITAAHILGKTKYDAELIPITSKASICKQYQH